MYLPQSTLLCRYRYDALDRLTSHNRPDNPRRQRFYCKSLLATEIQGAIRYSIVQHDDLLLAQQQHQDDVLDTTLLATDLQRSVLHTLKKIAQPQPIAYSPYGHRSAENGLTSLLGFNGERSDPLTGHYLLGNGYRGFNPVLMRFNSPDSLSPFEKGGMNAYAYCFGDPVNQSDPTGNSAISNMLVSLFERALKIVGRSPRSTTFSFNTTTTTFKSGPTRVMFRPTTDSWYLAIDNTDTSGKITAVKRVEKTHGWINGYDNSEHFSYKATPSLQEIIYSKIPGVEIKEFPLGFAMRDMHELHQKNAFTAHLNMMKYMRENSVRAPYFREIARNDLMRAIREGNVRGVNPNYVEHGLPF